ncbi:MAG: HD domain-containing protein, partial [Proteobacteria bacterium]|nr:HD domain-containing protein [Pseudomonadota bacterium]
MSPIFLNILAEVFEMRDPYRDSHQKRVSQLACAMAREMNLPEEQIEGIRVAGNIHDIGKISVPMEILSKPGRVNK